VDEDVAANRALWEEWTGIHAGSAFYDVASFRRGGVRLSPYEIEEVGDVRGQDLLHLQCHFGLDTLSWARLGARVTGADFSPAAIDLARRLAAELEIDARFVCSELGRLPDALEGDFDVVYTSRGVLGWLPDLERWARVIAHFLRPGGRFYVTEIHPVAQVLDDDEGVTELRVRYPYFARPEALRFPVKGSYAEPDADVKAEWEHAWVHDLGEIVTRLAAAGLRIEFLHEHPWVEWSLPFLEPAEDGTWRLPERVEGELPLSFSLLARAAG
jgi:SAM-dependent methyltransferase